jgi:acyl-CoA thioesterase FadM
LTRTLDGGSEWEFFYPVRPGDLVTVTVKLASVVQRTGRLGQMIILTRETTYVNQLGQIVAIQRSTSISY